MLLYKKGYVIEIHKFRMILYNGVAWSPEELCNIHFEPTSRMRQIRQHNP